MPAASRLRAAGSPVRLLASGIGPRTLRDRLAERLKRHIAERGLRPGDRLPTEHDLAQQFGVSRTAVREAAKSLEALGYLQSRPRHGMIVREPDWSVMSEALSFSLATQGGTVAHVFEVRRLLEVNILPIVIERASEADLARIGEAVSEMRQAVEGGSLGLDEDVRFHQALFAATHNPLFRNIQETIAAFFQEVRAVHLSAGKEGRLRACQDHVAIFEAILAGDARAAKERMRAHLDDYLRRGLIEPPVNAGEGNEAER